MIATISDAQLVILCTLFKTEIVELLVFLKMEWYHRSLFKIYNVFITNLFVYSIDYRIILNLIGPLACISEYMVNTTDRPLCGVYLFIYFW